MKPIRQRIFSAMIVLALTLSLVPVAYAATYDYAVQGGNLKFDPTTGTITGCDRDVYEATIPREIEGIPVTQIAYSAFGYKAAKLRKVTIPSSISEIGRGAFYQSYLKEVVISNGVTRIGEIAFSLSKLESVTIPSSVEIIDESAFSICRNLRSATLQEGVKKLGRRAFCNCAALENITLPDTLEEIKEYTFSEDSSLTSITIGSNVRYIGDYAFEKCKSLGEIRFRGDAPIVGKDIFGFHGIDGLIIYYPEGASGWTTPTWNGYITKSYQLDPPKPVTPPPSGLVTAVPTSSKVYVNGTAVAFDAYNIKDNNYFKLRDLAFVLSGSSAQFDVSWDGAANAIRLTSGQAYTPVGGEMSARGAINKIGTPTNSALYLNNTPVSFTAYNIDNNNYFKLRDIGQALNFSVEWNGATNSIEINTSLPYRSE